MVLALDGELVAAGPGGRRTIPARDFFVDYLQSALAPDELLVEVRVPKTDGWTFHYEKFHRVAQAWAIVGVAALVRRTDGHIAEARIGLTNMGATPLLPGPWPGPPRRRPRAPGRRRTCPPRPSTGSTSRGC